MNADNELKVAPDFFAGYFPKDGQVRATQDGTEPCLEVEEALYDRVRRWTTEHKIILGEGYTRIWFTGHPVYPASISMVAPVVSKEGVQEPITGIYNATDLNKTD